MDEFIKSANKGKISSSGTGKIKVDSPKKKIGKPVSLDKKKARAGWLFVLPFIIGFVLIYMPMIFDSIKISFHEMETLRTGGYELHWVGFENYKTALMTQSFVTTLASGIGAFLLEIPAIIIFSLFVAIILNQKMAGRAAFRAIFFIPVILATGLISEIDASSGLNAVVDPSVGSIDTGSGKDQVAEIVSAMDIQALFSNMVVGTELLEYVAQIVNNIYNIINRCGVQMLIFLSGLQSISPAIYESCSIDGASAWESFWKITLPMISPMILVNSVYTIIDSFTAESNSVMSYISGVYNTDTTGQVVSSAMSWMYFLVVILLVAIVAGILRLFIFYQRRD